MKVRGTLIIIFFILLTLLTNVGCAPGMAWAG